MGRQRSEIGAFVIPHDLVSVRYGKSAVRFLVIGLIGATTVVAGTADAEIIIPCYGRDAPGAYFVDNFVRPGVITDQITETVNCIGLLLVDAGKEGL